MDYRAYESVLDFLTCAGPWLEAHEQVGGLMLGIALRLRDEPQARRDGRNLLVTLTEGDDLRAVALMTPPHKLQFHVCGVEPLSTMRALADGIHGDGWTVPAVLAEERMAEAFAARWGDLAGTTTRRGMAQRVHALTAVREPAWPAGGFRQAGEADHAVLVPWAQQFCLDCHLEEDLPKVADLVRQRVAAGAIWLWDDDGPVAMAGRTRPTPHGETVNFVYTPPENRGRGYASAVVARLSQQILDAGKTFCTLFTDLANPTSNSIYRKLGYQGVADIIDVHLEHPRLAETSYRR